MDTIIGSKHIKEKVMISTQDMLIIYFIISAVISMIGMLVYAKIEEMQITVTFTLIVIVVLTSFGWFILPAALMALLLERCERIIVLDFRKERNDD